VGTYRLLRQDNLPQSLSLYSAQEFDLAPLLARHADKRFLELGRSCVLPDYRGKRTIELLWRGIWTYVKHHRIDVMIGCASFDTINPQAISLPLNFLHQTALAQGEWQVSALTKRAIAPTRLDANKTEFQPAQLRQALHALPPLIKGYLRVGARFGSGAVVDYQFGTTDVLVIMPVKDIDPRYVDHFDSALARPCAA
jgi:putative hemolysin